MIRIKSTALLLAAMAALSGCGSADPPGATGGTGGTSRPPKCDIPECFRAVQCVAECGGPVLSSSCCPCPEGTIDSIQCASGGATQ